MFFLVFNVLLSCICFIQAFNFYGFGNSYRFLERELSSTFDVFDSSSIETKWIDQNVDHFNNSDNRKWRMRYFERLDYWKSDGPIYLFMYGEAKASNWFLQTGILYDLAKETNGAMYLSEHRYYGESKPFPEFTTENLQYLSARQALADNAELLAHIKSLPKFNNSKVVVVGGSYAGNLAAWLRLHYPGLVDVAIASSAPVLAKKDFYEYLEKVSDDYEQHGTPGCWDKISEIFKRYDHLFQTRAGIKQLKEEEQICDCSDMTKPENRQLFFLDKVSAFMSEAQYGSTDSIRESCQKLNNVSRILSSHGEETMTWDARENCNDYDFDHMIEHIKGGDWIKSWIYQTCTEFGYYQSTNSEKHPFTDNVPVEWYYKLCSKTFGDEFTEQRIDEGVKNSNILYGGLNPNVTHVVFVNGDLDPWSNLGVLEDISYDAPAKMIPMSSHCRDLFSDRSEDPEELIEARKYIKYMIKNWIGVGEYKHPE